MCFTCECDFANVLQRSLALSAMYAMFKVFLQTTVSLIYCTATWFRANEDGCLTFFGSLTINRLTQHLDHVDCCLTQQPEPHPSSLVLVLVWLKSGGTLPLL